MNSEKTAVIEETDNLNLWKFKADFIYPYSRTLVWKFGASAQFISSKYTPTDIVENDRFETSDIPTKTSGFTPIVYASAQGRFWKLKYSAGVNWQLNRISYENCSVDKKYKYPMVNKSDRTGNDAFRLENGSRPHVQL